MLVLLNIGFILWVLITDCSAKRRMKAWLARKQLFESQLEQKKQYKKTKDSPKDKPLSAIREQSEEDSSRDK